MKATVLITSTAVWASADVMYRQSTVFVVPMYTAAAKLPTKTREMKGTRKNGCRS